MSQLHQPQQLMEKASLIYDTATVTQAITRVANAVTAVLADSTPVVICVMGGGLIFAGQLITQLHFPLEIDYVHASRYQNSTAGKTLTWKALPKLDLINRTVLLIDDILDEGVTLKAIQEKCLALGASKVYSAVLVEKELTIDKPIKADFVGLPVPNRYVFGYGMDAYGWWRNLPAIYALDVLN